MLKLIHIISTINSKTVHYSIYLAEFLISVLENKLGKNMVLAIVTSAINSE